MIVLSKFESKHSRNCTRSRLYQLVIIIYNNTDPYERSICYVLGSIIYAYISANFNIESMTHHHRSVEELTGVVAGRVVGRRSGAAAGRAKAVRPLEVRRHLRRLNEATEFAAEKP